jgi:hypothetical protein
MGFWGLPYFKEQLEEAKERWKKNKTKVIIIAISMTLFWFLFLRWYIIPQWGIRY